MPNVCLQNERMQYKKRSINKGNNTYWPLALHKKRPISLSNIMVCHHICSCLHWNRVIKQTDEQSSFLMHLSSEHFKILGNKVWSLSSNSNTTEEICKGKSPQFKKQYIIHKWKVALGCRWYSESTSSNNCQRLLSMRILFRYCTPRLCFSLEVMRFSELSPEGTKDVLQTLKLLTSSCSK